MAMSEEFRRKTRHSDEFWAQKMKLEKIREENKQNYNEDSNRRLCKIIEKNFNTSIIGAIADFEQDFGYIWGADELVLEVDSDDYSSAKKKIIEKCPEGWTPNLNLNKNSFFEEDGKQYVAVNIKKNDDRLTKEEKIARDVWEDCRKSILDRGNNKKRASVKEIQNHDVKWNKYNYNFKFRS